ncbi:phosphate signaling complex protein PhoU [Rhodothermus marinus]|uniref:Phosphate-specific transport system accessory protein PhoU n=1 Tax=Rhodothermus marinus (strain ATCC 43812 / DSM 4252 / R-10) TaxID=518766 RepID=D0MJQ0_RHOM4|nr:phosphate signaling complex protein PhoU [Rhodothermus marinus]ACY48708.1 phosphate uptake regulator, PhoU [Rhodothermus marinus DSM 4252]AEN73694.1 phosphate uptake regulator, PhoU [Rhodothermus marinus SG0.5JP17-172]
MTVHRHIDDELLVLQRMLFEMADLVDEQMANAIDALLRRDLELAERVRARDDEVDAYELKIDRQCERILALHHPVAAELRMIITAVKVNTDLERIGDHCKNLAKHTPYVVQAPEALAQTRIEEMADASRAMLRQVQEAFLKRDRLLARQVLAEDLQIDRLHRENFEQLVRFGRQHPEHLEAVAHLITASKALERISDHAKNIAESVVFLIEGVDIRHRKLREPQAQEGERPL